MVKLHILSGPLHVFLLNNIISILFRIIYIKAYFYILGLSSHNINSQRTHFLGERLDPETEQNGLSNRGVEGLRQSGGSVNSKQNISYIFREKEIFQQWKQNSGKGSQRICCLWF